MHFLSAVDTPEPGVFGKLTSDGCPLLVRSGGRIVCFIDPNLEYTPRTFTYTDPDGGAYTMDALGNIKAVKDLQGNALTFAQDGIRSNIDGVHIPFERDTSGRITHITDLSGGAYHYEYDDAGNLTAVVLPGGGRHSYTYDSRHALLAVKDPNGNEPATATYYPDGRIESVRDALGNITRYTYDTAARTTTMTNPDGGRVVERYDDAGRLLARRIRSAERTRTSTTPRACASRKPTRQARRRALPMTMKAAS